MPIGHGLYVHCERTDGGLLKHGRTQLYSNRRSVIVEGDGQGDSGSPGEVVGTGELGELPGGQRKSVVSNSPGVTGQIKTSSTRSAPPRLNSRNG